MKDELYTIEDRKRNSSMGGLKRAKNAGERIGAEWTAIAIADWVLAALDKAREDESRNDYLRKLLEKK